MIGSRVLASAIIAYALTVVLIAPGVTRAESIEGPPIKVVRFTDLNLDTRADVEILFRRIQVAAVTVCKPYEPHGTYLPSAAYRFCIGNAVSGAVLKVGSPLLMAYYGERDYRHSLTAVGGR